MLSMVWLSKFSITIASRLLRAIARTFPIPAYKRSSNEREVASVSSLPKCVREACTCSERDMRRRRNFDSEGVHSTKRTRPCVVEQMLDHLAAASGDDSIRRAY